MATEALEPKSIPILLHVEDDDSDARLVVRSFALAAQDVCIHHAIDGRIALDMLDRIEEGLLPMPDLIVLDLKLPFATGHEILARAKSSAALANIPVVILTSSNAPRDRQQCLSAGCADYLVKPIEYQEFVALVQDMGRRFLLEPASTPLRKISVV